MNAVIDSNGITGRMKPFSELLRNPQNVITVDLHTSGYVLMNSGLRELAAECGLTLEEERPFEDAPDIRVLTARSGGVEFLQIGEQDADEETNTEQPA